MELEIGGGLGDDAQIRFFLDGAFYFKFLGEEGDGELFL